jgi:hypothetical protein
VKEGFTLTTPITNGIGVVFLQKDLYVADT